MPHTYRHHLTDIPPLPPHSFIIETCHEAAQTASYSRRSKVKVEDFKFVLRKDPRKLGRVTELLNMDRDIKSKRKAFVVDEDQIGKVEVKDDGSGAAVAEGKAGKAEVTGEGKVRKKDGAGRAQKRQRVKKG